MHDSDSESNSSASSGSSSGPSSGEVCTSTIDGKNVVDTIKTYVNNEENKRKEKRYETLKDQSEKPRSKSRDKNRPDKKKNVSSSESSSSNTDSSSSSDSSDSGETDSSTSGDEDRNMLPKIATIEKRREVFEHDSQKRTSGTADVQKRKTSKDNVAKSLRESSDEDPIRKENQTKDKYVTDKTQKSPEKDSKRISEIPREISKTLNDTNERDQNRGDSDEKNAGGSNSDRGEKKTYIAAVNVVLETVEPVSRKSPEKKIKIQQSTSSKDKVDEIKSIECSKESMDEIIVHEDGNDKDLKSYEKDIRNKQQSIVIDNKERSKDIPELKQLKSSSDSDGNSEANKGPSVPENTNVSQKNQKGTESNHGAECVSYVSGDSCNSKSTSPKVVAQKTSQYECEEGELHEDKDDQIQCSSKTNHDSGESTRSITQRSRSPSKENQQQLSSVSPKPKKSSRSQSRSREPQYKPQSGSSLRSRSRDIERNRRSGSRKRNYSRERRAASTSKSRSQSRSKEKQCDRRSKSRSHSRSRQTQRKQRSKSRSPRRSHSREKRTERKFDDRSHSQSSEYERRRSRRSESLERRRDERKRRHAERDERDKSKRFKRDDEDVRTHKDSSDNTSTAEAGKEKNNDNVTVTDPKAEITERQRKTVDILTSRTGGAYIPPAKLRLMQAKITDKASAAYQRIAWEALKKSIHGYINKVNVDNIAIITRELLKENIVRGRGLLCRSIIQAQAASPTFTHVYAALVSIINSKFPNIGELLLKRLVIQFKRAFRRNDKAVCLSSSRFVAHLVNQRVAHEILALEILTLLVESPTDDSVEVAISFLKECGMKLTEVSSKGIGAIFEMLKNILHEGKLDKRVQYMIEVVFQVRKDGFKDHQSVIESLELVEEDDQFTHLLMLDDATNPEDILNAFKFDEEYEVNEDKYKGLSKEILGSDGSNSGDSSGSGSGSDSGSYESEGDKDGDDEKAVAGDIIDSTETNLIALRRTIYLTINSSLDYEECAHKLMKMQLKPGQEIELCHMFLDCCAEQRTYEKFYGLLAQRFCLINKSYIEPFEEIFCDTYGTTHRLDTNRLRNVSKFFAHLLFTDAISWDVMECIRLNEDDTTSSSRIFIKILFQELAEYMGLSQLNKKLKDEVLGDSLAGLFPKDNPRNSRFSINFFTSIGLGGLTDELRQFLKNAPKSVPAINAEILANKPIHVSASSKSSSSSSSSSDTSSDSSSSDSEEEKRKRKGKGKKQKTKKKEKKEKSKKSKKKSKKSNKKHKKSRKAETTDEDSKSSSSDSDSKSSQSSTSSDSGNEKQKSKKKDKLRKNKKLKRLENSDDEKQSENEDLSKSRKLQNENDGTDVQRDDRRNRYDNIRSERDTRRPPPPQRRESEIERRREEREKRHREKEQVQERDRNRTRSRSRSRDRRGGGGGDDRNRRDGRSERNRETDRDSNRRRYRHDDHKSRSHSRDRHEKRERDYERSRPRNTSKERG